jgi:2-polyprenyl-3-methyl-5-hydroxy-6-metoxy-1,4-benzoquinol methylase
MTDSEAALIRAERELWRRYQMAPVATRAYIFIRLRNFPKRLVWPALMDLYGAVVSVGAGYGLFETMAALANPAVTFIASDARAKRIALARQATQGIPNIQFEVFDLERGLPEVHAATFLLFDVLHHLPPEVQRTLLGGLVERLPRGGRILIKECGTRPVWKLCFNYLTDLVGAPGEATYPRSERHWASLLAAGGLETRVTRLDRGSPWAHILIDGRKP